LKAEFASLGSKPGFPAFAKASLLLNEDAFIVGLPPRQKVIDDSSELMGSGGNGFGSAETGTHPTVVLWLLWRLSAAILRARAARFFVGPVLEDNTFPPLTRLLGQRRSQEANASAVATGPGTTLLDGL
jgi:hypothetical protein